MFYSFLQNTALPAALLHMLLHVLLTSGTGHLLDISLYVPQYVNSILRANFLCTLIRERGSVLYLGMATEILNLP